MFVRFLRPRQMKEILVNLNCVTRIEVTYQIPGRDGTRRVVSLARGDQNPDAIRVYRLFAGSEEIQVPAKPDDPVCQAIEKIYHNAVKA